MAMLLWGEFMLQLNTGPFAQTVKLEQAKTSDMGAEIQAAAMQGWLRARRDLKYYSSLPGRQNSHCHSLLELP